jgi:hypothetical protein
MNEIAIATEKQASAWKVKKLKRAMKVEKKVADHGTSSH